MRVSRQPTLQRRASNPNAQITASGIPDAMAFQPPVFQLFASDQTSVMEEEEEMDQDVVQQKAEAEPAFEAPPEENNGGDENGANDDDSGTGDSGDSGNGDARDNGNELDGQTGMPMQLKTGIESMSGMDMSDVKVHYNSDKPIQMKAHAYAQGSDIHLGPGQEKHLPHEAWHVVQQKQGRVQATTQLKADGSQGVPLNDDAGLEQEADVMGAKALEAGRNARTGGAPLQRKSINFGTVQRIELEDGNEPDAPKEEKNMANKMAHEPELLNQKGHPEEIKGSTPKTEPAGWEYIKLKKGSPKGQWVRFHLINHNIGGKGENFNLVPTTVAINLGNKWRTFEERVKMAFEYNYWVWMRVEVDYYDKNDAGADGFPSSIEAVAKYYDDDKGKWRSLAKCDLDPGIPDLQDDGKFKRFEEMNNDGYWLRALPEKKFNSKKKTERFKEFRKKSADTLHKYVNECNRPLTRPKPFKPKLIYDRWQERTVGYVIKDMDEDERIEFTNLLEDPINEIIDGENPDLNVIFPDKNYVAPSIDNNGFLIKDILHYDRLMELKDRKPTKKELNYFMEQYEKRNPNFKNPKNLSAKQLFKNAQKTYQQNQFIGYGNFNFMDNNNDNNLPPEVDFSTPKQDSKEEKNDDYQNDNNMNVNSWGYGTTTNNNNNTNNNTFNWDITNNNNNSGQTISNNYLNLDDFDDNDNLGINQFGMGDMNNIVSMNDSNLFNTNNNNSNTKKEQMNVDNTPQQQNNSNVIKEPIQIDKPQIIPQQQNIPNNNNNSNLLNNNNGYSNNGYSNNNNGNMNNNINTQTNNNQYNHSSNNNNNTISNRNIIQDDYDLNFQPNFTFNDQNIMNNNAPLINNNLMLTNNGMGMKNTSLSNHFDPYGMNMSNIKFIYVLDPIDQEIKELQSKIDEVSDQMNLAYKLQLQYQNSIQVQQEIINSCHLQEQNISLQRKQLGELLINTLSNNQSNNNNNNNNGQSLYQKNMSSLGQQNFNQFKQFQDQLNQKAIQLKKNINEANMSIANDLKLLDLATKSYKSYSTDLMNLHNSLIKAKQKKNKQGINRYNNNYKNFNNNNNNGNYGNGGQGQFGGLI